MHCFLEPAGECLVRQRDANCGGDGGDGGVILLDNRANIVSSLTKLRHELQTIEQMIKKRDAEGVRRWLDERRNRREAINENR